MRHGRTAGSDETNEQGCGGADADEERKGLASRPYWGLILGRLFGRRDGRLITGHNYWDYVAQTAWLTGKKKIQKGQKMDGAGWVQ